jgi:hypothetical protein
VTSTAQAVELSHNNNMPAHVGGDDQLVSMIERVVNNPEIPIDRLEQMLALKERQEDRLRAQMREDREYAAKRAFFAAMSKCQKELPVVTKTKKNTHTNSTYADLAAIEAQAMPVIHANGFAVSFQPDGYNDKGELRILWEISHEEGHFRSGVGEIPVDGAGSQGKVNKTGTQAFGSTATYGRRYLLCMLFNITTGDDTDGNAQPAEVITDEQRQNLLDLMDEVGFTTADDTRLMKVFKIQYLADLPAKDFDRAVALVKGKKP